VNLIAWHRIWQNYSVHVYSFHNRTHEHSALTPRWAYNWVGFRTLSTAVFSHIPWPSVPAWRALYLPGGVCNSSYTLMARSFIVPAVAQRTGVSTLAGDKCAGRNCRCTPSCLQATKDSGPTAPCACRAFHQTLTLAPALRLSMPVCPRPHRRCTHRQPPHTQRLPRGCACAWDLKTAALQPHDLV